MRASRLVSLLLLLQNRGRMTAPELAAELEVSVRTVYRDVESLVAAGIPLYADRGPAGGYQLVEGYRTRLTGLTAAEADSLLFAGLPGPAAELGLGAVLTAAQLKLRAALPPEFRDRADRIRERFLFDAPGWFRETERLTHLAAVADAVWAERVLDVRYEDWGGRRARRELCPLGIVLKGGVWYLVATTPARSRTTPTPPPPSKATPPSGDRPRTYRVSRIISLTATDRHFVRQRGFDLTEFWASRAEQVRARLFHGVATIRLAPRGRELAFLLGPVVHRAIEEQWPAHDQPPEGADAWRTLTIPTETEDHALHALLQLGDAVEVLAPQALRRRVAAEVAALAERYRPAAAG